MTNERAEAALRRLIEDAKQAAPPRIDADRLEAALMQKVAATPRPAPTSRRVVPVVLALAAAALGAALLVHRTPRTSVPTSETPTATRTDSVNGDGLSVGARVSSSASAVTVVHAGHVTWELAPEGTALVERTGEIVEIALERGTVSAQVTKSDKPESFAVRVENTRVAVHGTRFRVERLEHTVRVVVDEGVVGVGPVSGPSFDLRAPSNAVVSFDGVRQDGTAGGGAPKPVEVAEAAPRPRPSASTPVEEKPAPERAAEGPGPGLDRVISAVRHCLSTNTVAGGDLRVTVRTRMSLRVLASGHAAEARFDPPLSPRVQTCVDSQVGSIGFSVSNGGFAVDRVIELER
ncbi:MAG TPA: FecR domain-containing protein [Polyangiaceae bacterium]|nr:FecR domain-containing protein [Polyangiaceae bacterium]